MKMQVRKKVTSSGGSGLHNPDINTAVGNYGTRKRTRGRK